VLRSRKEMFLPEWSMILWFARAFIIGHGDLESPSLGGSYEGHVRLCPAAWAGTTAPCAREGVTRLRIKRPKSHVKTAILIKKPAILFRIPILLVAVSLKVAVEGLRLNSGMSAFTANKDGG